MAHEQRPLYTHVSARAGSVVSQARHTPDSFLPLSTLSSWKFFKKTCYFCDIHFSIFLSLFLFFVSLFSISVSPHILCVCLSPEGSRATRLINNYRVHKIGKEAKKKKTLCRLMSNMRETKITKRQNSIKRRESLHIPFSILCFCSLLFCFFNFFFLFYCLLCFCWGGFIASVSVLSL